MTATVTMQVNAIPADVLRRLRHELTDGLGHDVVAFGAEGWEPLRCCLRRADAAERIALISYSPTPVPGPWQEFGPVFVHVDACDGYDPDAGLPPQFRTGPRVLRSYRADGSLNYDAITVVDDDRDLERPLAELVARDDVAEVHVRTLGPQCFVYAVRRG